MDSDWHYSYTGDEAHPIFERINTEHGAQNKPLNDLTCVAKIILFTLHLEMTKMMLHYFSMHLKVSVLVNMRLNDWLLLR
ncbi:hypothetical protein [Bacillus sp. Hm123]|uniref:hypothetical protein n=1 Tax=Bacillus sp. Hm123 TaxID=3450745 RepID=UPI003F441E76